LCLRAFLGQLRWLTDVTDWVSLEFGGKTFADLGDGSCLSDFSDFELDWSCAWGFAVTLLAHVGRVGAAGAVGVLAWVTVLPTALIGIPWLTRAALLWIAVLIALRTFLNVVATAVLATLWKHMCLAKLIVVVTLWRLGKSYTLIPLWIADETVVTLTLLGRVIPG
jgi:hypothetical protein